LDSRSATRFFSASTSSSSHLSRSVNPGAGASIFMEAGFAAAGFAGGSLVFLSAVLSSANKRPGTTIVQSNVATSSQESLLSFLNARISLSYSLPASDTFPGGGSRHSIVRLGLRPP
jgi:hypothetical protein